MDVGNGLYIDVVPLKSESVGEYRFLSSPIVKGVNRKGDVLTYIIECTKHVPKDIKFKLLINNPRKSYANVKVSKADGESEEFRIMTEYEEIQSLGEKGDFVIITGEAEESTALKKIYGECTMEITTWKMEPLRVSVSDLMGRNGVRHGIQTDGPGSTLCGADEVDGPGSTWHSGIELGHFGVKGTSTQKFTTAPLAFKDTYSERRTIVKFLVCKNDEEQCACGLRLTLDKKPVY